MNTHPTTQPGAFERVMADCAAHYERRIQAAEAHANEAARLADDFTRAVLSGNVDQSIHGRRTGARVNGTWTPDARPEALWETMLDTMDYADLDQRCMRALAACAKLGQPEAVSAIQALAARYGHMTAEVE